MSINGIDYSQTYAIVIATMDPLSVQQNTQVVSHVLTGTDLTRTIRQSIELDDTDEITNDILTDWLNGYYGSLWAVALLPDTENWDENRPALTEAIQDDILQPRGVWTPEMIAETLVQYD